MNASKQLQLAKAVLIERGWCQGDYVNPVTGEVCIVGAFNIVQDGDPRCIDEDDSEPVPSDGFYWLEKLAIRHWSFDVGHWNDARGRTPEQVLAFYDAAIALAEAFEAAQAIDQPVAVAAVRASIDQPVVSSRG